MLSLCCYEKRREFNTQHLSFLQIITVNVLFDCGESKAHVTGPTSEVIFQSYITA